MHNLWHKYCATQLKYYEKQKAELQVDVCLFS